MKKYLVSLLVTTVVLISSATLYAQDSRSVTITTNGSGKTPEEAKQAALRSAIEQAFGAFISSKTEVLNDQVVADQMASVASGNIESFEILSEAELPGGNWGVTLKAIVSVDKLTSFVQAKGITIEIKGGLFALNIKQQSLNEQGEINAIFEMVGVLHEPMQTAFDYSLKTRNPKSLDSENKNWEIPLEVTATANQNMDFCANYFIKTLQAVSLTETEIQSYKNLNKEIFPFSVKYKNKDYKFFLRKKLSVVAIGSFLRRWTFYSSAFVVDSGLDQIQDMRFKEDEEGILNLQNINFGYSNIFPNEDLSINIPNIGEKIYTFTWNDKRTLTQIERMQGYTVKPLGVRSQYKHGGIVIYEKNGHGFVVAMSHLDKDVSYQDAEARNSCKELNINGYSDWMIPNRQFFNSFINNILPNIRQNKIGLPLSGVRDTLRIFIIDGSAEISYQWNRLNYEFETSKYLGSGIVIPIRIF
jgi:hypothetical protein